MKPIDQTTFGVPGGNCFSACVASLLELSIDDVPYFMGDCDEDGDGGDSMRSRFAARKRTVLRAVAAERKTQVEAVAVLEKLYSRMTGEFLAVEGTTYGDWLKHGPRAEFVEVREALRDDAVWDRLVDRHATHLGARS